MRRVSLPITLTRPGEDAPGGHPGIPPETPPGAVPTAPPLPGSHFLWRSRRYVVQEVLDGWQEAGCWWDDEPVIEGFHVAFRGGGTGILLFHRPRGPWVLDRIDD